MVVRLSGAALDHDQRRRPAARIVARGTGRDDLAGGRAGRRIACGTSALADRARAPRDLRGDAGGKREAARRQDRVQQSLPCGRLDRHGLARDHRRCHSVRQHGLRNWRCGTERQIPSDERYTRQAGDAAGSARSRAGAPHPRRDRRGPRRAAARRALGLRARSRRDDPGRVRADGALLRGRAEPRARAQDRRLPAPHPGRARRLAAVSRGRLRHERQREGVFRAEDDR